MGSRREFKLGIETRDAGNPAVSETPRRYSHTSDNGGGLGPLLATEACGGNAARLEIHTTVETRLSGLRTNPSTQRRRRDCVERPSSPATVAAFLAMYFATVVCPASMPSLSSSLDANLSTARPQT